MTFAKHRLVALAYMPNEDPNTKRVDHIDGNPLKLIK